MNERVAAVEPNGENPKGSLPDEPGNDRATADPNGRFTYASGSRPLEGFTIKRGVGHGGFGEVYFATSEAGKEVALKLIRRNFDVELRGIRHCLNLKHPNLLAIFDIRQDARGDHWVVMEYVAGQRLDDAIGAHPNGMPLDRVTAWIHGIAAGVAYLHDHGIVHRDLKPGNLFNDEGMVKVGDYGLSKFISASRRSGQTESVGTVHYMAPEVANGRYGREVDLYAVGIILYEMLSGQVPFEGESVGEVLMKHLTATPDVSILPQPYRSVVARALEKDPAKRFGSLQEMLAALPKPAGPAGSASTWPLGAKGYAPGSHIPNGPAMPPLGAAAEPAPGATPATASSPAPEPTDEEPLWWATRQTIQQARTAWREWKLDPRRKKAILVLGVVLLVCTTGGWAPIAVSLLLVYLGYYLFRSVFLFLFPPSTSQHGYYFSAQHEPALCDPPPAQAEPVASAQPEAPRADSPRPGGPPAGEARSATLPSWASRERRPDVLARRSRRQRFAELVGSMVGGALVAMTMCVVMGMITSFHSGTVPPPQLWAWVMLVSIAGTWAVLIPSKLWEGTRGEPVVRRFTLMVLGLFLGVFAAGMAQLLHVTLPYTSFPEDANYTYALFSGFYSDNGSPLLLAHMACFGSLFFLLRWWRQADPLRRARLSLGSVIVCIVIAWLIASMLEFPHLWPMMIAAAVSTAVQLSSPWLNPRNKQTHGLPE